MTKLSDNVTKIEKEIQNGDFNLNLKDHILYLPSFIDSNKLIIAVSWKLRKNIKILYQIPHRYMYRNLKFFLKKPIK